VKGNIMAQLMQTFDARTVDPTQSVGGLPIGRHVVKAVKSELKATKDDSNGYVQYDLMIIDGDHKGEVGAYRLNMYHSNPKTVEIARRQFSALCHVTGVYQVSDSNQLLNIPFMVEVGLQKDPNPQGYTEVKKVFDANGNEPGQANRAPASQSAAPAAGWSAPVANVPPPAADGAAATPTWGQQPQQQPQQQPAASWTQQGSTTATTPPWGRWF
jgi:hypothetical protein